MHLKSLILKGFKSFADRAVLQMEPGITAIVGPNGSGKSNISDAVLWVLGERNARNLRGQAMEDIIFSGSAARHAVSIAEVELVLDNSDGTLPVDFDEVSIARRMYRNGESEYLINGVISRRMDVLDILHDTGLGTGTHSIISQGSLDTILQSRPEDRRALIEEAAGVLKHKQRKEKSARKLERMDNHLARVRDVVAEIERQLAPLERKAKRAEAYKVASAELAELKLALAVDDLRRLQELWESICSSEQVLSEEVGELRASVDAAEQRSIDLQSLIRQASEDAGALTRQQRRAESIAERLEGVEMVIGERRRTVRGYEADAQATLAGQAERKQAAARELELANEQLTAVEAEAQVANETLGRMEAEREAAATAMREAQSELDRLGREMRSLETLLDEARHKKAELQEDVSSSIAHGRLIDARKAELTSDLERAQAEYDAKASEERQARELLQECEERDRAARAALGAGLDARDSARAQRDASEESLRVAQAEIKAIEQAQRASRADNPSLEWLMDGADGIGEGLAPVARALKAPANLERLVEHLLGADLEALAASDPDRARAVADALASGARRGDVALVLMSDAAARACPDAARAEGGHPLIDDLTYPADWDRAVRALLGDVVVCSSRKQAFEAHAKDALGCRFISVDGTVVWPQGKVTIIGAAPEHDEGVLARERRLADAKGARDGAQSACEAARASVEEAEEAYRNAQAESLKASQQLAEQRGAAQAAQADEQRAKARLASVAAEIEDIERQREQATRALEALRPGIEDAQAKIDEVEQRRAACQEQHAVLSDRLAPLRDEAERLSEQLTEARLSAATLAERLAYAQRIRDSRMQDVRTIDLDTAEARRTAAVKAEAGRRAEPLLAVIGALARTLRARAGVLDAAIAQSEGAASDVHAQADAARRAAREARDGYDDAQARIAQVRVEKGRLEVQVDAAVRAVTQDCATPLDRAQDLPQLEDRAAAEDDVFRLERRIKNMGVINPDAAEEYRQLKERYDFLAGQMQDMETARKSLARIEHVIDVRMKEDFSRTFEQVSENFSEIFAVLFPGGQGSLVLEDPDDLENTGVEVVAQPRGKRITKMMLMSGGEKSLTALALLFAVYRTRSTPFYILDEVEAALDDTNLRRLMSYIDELRDSTQLIMITHQRRTMEMADVLFGVSMQADGVTKVISQKLERALEQAE